jgi:tRNA threonylcarbamoyladenosine biosynthesis protein TsaB
MILALETSTSEGSLALIEPGTGELLHTTSYHSDRSHNTALFAPLEDILKKAPAPISLLVVGTGPGSYGGVRSGIAAVLGLSLSLGCPAMGLPSIATLAPDALVVGDARRSSFFVAEIRNHQLVAFPQVHDEPSFRAAVQNATLPVLTMDSQAPLGLPHIEVRLPNATSLARIAQQMNGSQRVDVIQQPLEPLYVRPPFITQAKPGRI